MADANCETKAVLSAREAGNLLGVAGKTVIRLAESDKLPAYKIGNVWRFKRVDVEAYLEAHRYRPGAKTDEDTKSGEEGESNS